jgi:hypothetical protein
MKALLCIAILSSFAFSARADESGASIDKLLLTVREEIPSTWSVFYEKQYNWLEISRNTSVMAASARPNLSVGEKADLKQFSFAFRVSPKMPPEEHQKLMAENVIIQNKAYLIYDDLIKRHVSHVFDEFSPETEEDKKLVDQYDSFKKSLHDIPEFYFHEISLKWIVNSPNNPVMSPIDSKTQVECDDIRDKVANLLSKYKDAEQGAAANP